MNVVEMHAIVHGKVQGVFFRDTTRKKAQEMGITGTVRNLLDGTVEIYAVGPLRDLEDLMDYLSGEQGPGRVDYSDINFVEPSGFYDGFQIIY